jgi:hypothetical protein
MKSTRKLAIALVTVLLLALSATYSLAQGKPGPGPRHPMADAGAVQEHPCIYEMHDLLAIADLKVEKTKSGAALQLSAKDPTKVSEVQSLADKFAEHVKSGVCPMKEKGAMMHGHQHGR